MLSLMRAGNIYYVCSLFLFFLNVVSDLFHINNPNNDIIIISVHVLRFLRFYSFNQNGKLLGQNILLTSVCFPTAPKPALL